MDKFILDIKSSYGKNHIFIDDKGLISLKNPESTLIQSLTNLDIKYKVTGFDVATLNYPWQGYQCNKELWNNIKK